MTVHIPLSTCANVPAKMSTMLNTNNVTVSFKERKRSTSRLIAPTYLKRIELMNR